MGSAALQGGDGIDRSLLGLLADHAAAGTACVLATVVRCEPPTSAHPGDTAVIGPGGELAGWIGGSCAEPLVRREALRALADGQPRLVRILPAQRVEQAPARGEVTIATSCPSGGALEVFVDPQLPRPLFLVVGGSPVARALVALGGAAGFWVCAVHPGAEPEDFPGAARVLSSLDLAPLRPGPDSWAVVATMGHYDEAALSAVLAHPDVDVGLVASLTRARSVLENLRAEGVDEATLRRVRIPAGGRRSGRQEEIALLALAEVVGLRLDRRAAAATEGPTPIGEGFATDPVCGMVVDLASSVHTATHGGGLLHFCGAHCRASFLAAPGGHSAAAPT